MVATTAMGVTVSDAVRVLLTRVAAEQALPFEVEVPNAKTRADLLLIYRKPNSETLQLIRLGSRGELFG